MKKLLVLLFLSMQISAQTITLEDLHYFTMNDYKTDKKFLNNKGFVFVEHHRMFANIYSSLFLKTGKDSLVVGLGGDTTIVYVIRLQFKSDAMYKSFLKSITGKGYVLNPKYSVKNNYDYYGKPKTKTYYTIGKNQEFSQVLEGKFYEIYYHNDHHE